RYSIGFGESEVWKGNEKGYWSSSVFEQIFEMTKQKGLDIFCSLWRDDGTMLALDIEYFNLSYPGEVHANPYKTFYKIEPVYQIIKKVFDEYGLELLITMTGQGYHFTCIWPFEYEHHLLENIGALEHTTIRKYQFRKYKIGGEVPLNIGKAFSGACRLIQFLTHKIIQECDKKRADGEKIIPVIFSDIPTGPAGKGIYNEGQEAISLDVTLYSDPVYARSIRIPFSTYQKHKVLRWKVGEWLANNVPICTCIPRYWPKMSFTPNLNDLMNIRRRNDNKHFDYTVEYANSADTKLPRNIEPWKKVINDYKKTRLYNFHKTFDEKYYTTETNPNFNIDNVIRELPPCYAAAMETPNDNLLKPFYLQGIIRILDKKGWHPKDIAQLIYSRYKPMRKWGYLSPEKLAHFWTELYCGAIWNGIDSKIDMNCISQQERNMCWKKFCGHNLQNYQ
ncbi:hypothetical protein KA977_00210, partial [Candidatus Dependentiae bacterium]|nr:hypothetical protein [Candidatus Dependentiae bacterium]